MLSGVFFSFTQHTQYMQISQRTLFRARSTVGRDHFNRNKTFLLCIGVNVNTVTHLDTGACREEHAIARRILCTSLLTRSILCIYLSFATTTFTRRNCDRRCLKTALDIATLQTVYSITHLVTDTIGAPDPEVQRNSLSVQSKGKTMLESTRFWDQLRRVPCTI